MPYASNHGVRSYFEDWGGPGSPVLVYTGLGDPIADAQRNPLVQALADGHRLLFADHRGHGRSDKPHDAHAYALRLRVGDARAVLDAAAVDRAHVLGFSWGARLGFAIGEHAPDRVRSLALGGNQPYAWNPRWRVVRELSAGFERAAAGGGMPAFVAALERSYGDELTTEIRARLLENDPIALAAAWRAALREGPVSADLGAWRLRCLIYVAAGDEMEAAAARAAAEIPRARFLLVHGRTHLSTAYEVDQVLPAVRELFAAADGEQAVKGGRSDEDEIDGTLDTRRRGGPGR